MKVIIVGGVAAGASAAARLRRLNEQAEITLFEKGPYISYANCGLPYYVGGAIPEREDLLLQTPESFFARTAVDVRVNSEVVAIDREKKTVEVLNHATGERYTQGYDYLLLSPGAAPFVPPMPGSDLPGVFTVKAVPDALAIREWARKTPGGRALVVGGGYIGVEMAENFAEMGMQVTLAELANQIIAPLDFDMAQELHHHIRRRGVDLRLNTGLSGLAQSEGGLIASLGDGTELEVDIAVLAIGVRPATGLAREAGLETDGRGFILTDEHMRTSDPYIFAAGDAVAVRLLKPTNKAASRWPARPIDRAGLWPTT
jgi:NADPH-dependent 2,4-dienoyl-CoA reductase/sulfur reductase-like enzyme